MPSDELMVLSVRLARDKDNCIVLFEDNTTIKLHIDLVIGNSIKKGISLKPDEVSSLLGKQRIAYAKLKAFKYAAGKNKTEFMISQNLRQKGFDKNEISAALDYLREYKVTDEMEFCRKYIQLCIERKSSGKIKIRSELLRKGVDSKTVDTALEKYFPDDNLLQLAMKAAEKKLRLIAGKPEDKKKLSLINSLRNAGFQESIIRKVIEQIADRVKH